MLPKPTIMILPANFTCTSCVLIIFLPCCFSSSLLSSIPPMRRVCALVSGKRLDAMNPTRQRRIVAFHGQKARAELRRGAAIERPPQQLYPRKNHHVERGVI